MCVPDLRGTQGMFSYYIEQGEAGATMDGDVGGDRILVHRNGKGVQSYLRGPANSLRNDGAELRLPFKVTESKNGSAAAYLHINGDQIPLKLNQHSDWVKIEFKAAPGFKVRGICKFYLKSFAQPFEMYCTPLQIDPDAPVMPISHPVVYSSYLARKHGSFSTLGLAEDTWSLSEKLLSEDAFPRPGLSDPRGTRENVLRHARARSPGHGRLRIRRAGSDPAHVFSASTTTSTRP